MPSIHFELNGEISILVRKEYLYNLESGFDEFIPAKLLAISSYPGHVPTFKVLVKDKYIFSYLPIQALASKEVEPMALKDANYFNCPSETLSISYFYSLGPCRVFNKDGSYLDDGIVVCTLDWYRDNELGHVVKLENGNYVIRPSHKLIFNFDKDKVEDLPKYKKLRHEWII